MYAETCCLRFAFEAQHRSSHILVPVPVDSCDFDQVHDLLAHWSVKDCPFPV